MQKYPGYLRDISGRYDTDTGRYDQRGERNRKRCGWCILADSCMYQRTYPDQVEHHGQKINLSGMEDWMNRLIFQKEEERQLLLSMEKWNMRIKNAAHSRTGLV